MEEPEIPSLTSFNQGEDDYGNKWVVGTFSKNGTELTAQQYDEGYSTSWDTFHNLEGIVEQFSKYYQIKGSVTVQERDESGGFRQRKYRLVEDHGNIDDYEFGDEILAVDLSSRDFGINWRKNGEELIKNGYTFPYNVTVYVNEEIDDIPEPFMEPTWLVMPTTSGPNADTETVDQLTQDAGKFINQTDWIFE
ncbi:hypothetical protein [Candidatus Nanohalovita haloferacivicina]|uniref:hypothetical protein n=1 Tax=Candidatus Nanohalovita haloferacivicina TaxID=2978046 RepID=UPI00325FDA23|nr:hypothetical protein HBNXNv_0570 [Candidatus Nanohalobia archaeon BNXNv]